MRLRIQCPCTELLVVFLGTGWTWATSLLQWPALHDAAACATYPRWPQNSEAAHTHTHACLSTSDFVSADISVRSPRQLSIFIIKSYMNRRNVSPKSFIWVWKQNHCCRQICYLEGKRKRVGYANTWLDVHAIRNICMHMYMIFLQNYRIHMDICIFKRCLGDRAIINNRQGNRTNNRTYCLEAYAASASYQELGLDIEGLQHTHSECGAFKTYAFSSTEAHVADQALWSAHHVSVRRSAAHQHACIWGGAGVWRAPSARFIMTHYRWTGKCSCSSCLDRR